MILECIDNTRGYENIFEIGKKYFAEKSDIQGYLNIQVDDKIIKYVYVSRFFPVELNKPKEG